MALALAALMLLGARALADGAILGAGSAAHGWLVLETAAPGAGAAGLYHMPADAEPGVALFVRRLAKMPEAMSAGGSRVVMVFEAAGGEASTRSVRAVSVGASPAPGFYVYEPRGREAGLALPSLPADGRLLELADAPFGGAALLEGDFTEQRVRLLGLFADQWLEFSLPEGVGAGSGLRAIGSEHGLALIEFAADGPARQWRLTAPPKPPAAADSPEGQAAGSPDTVAAPRAPLEAEWSASPIALEASDEILVAAGSSVVAGARDAAGVVRLSLVRGMERFPLATVEGIPERFSVVRSGDRVSMVWADTAKSPPRLHAAVVSAVTGQILHQGESVQGDSPLRLQDLQVLALLLGAVMLTVLLFVLRPDAAARAAITLPEGTALASPGVRAVAWIIDLAPGVLISARIYGVDVASIVTAPFQPVGAEGIWPLVTALWVTLAYGSVAEWLWGRTLGKALLRLRAVSISGGRLTLWQAVSRNAAKTLAPPVALLAFIDANRRHPGDVLSGSVVVQRIPGGQGADGGEGSGDGPDR